MLTSRSANKPSRIQPGDEYASFGGPISVNSNKSPKKSRKNKSHNTPENDGFGSYGFHAASGLSSTGELTNPFGEIVSDYDIEVSYAALSALSDDKRVTITQFTEWMNKYLQLNWNEQRIKRAWAVLDQAKAKYITFKEFRSGLKSTNSDVILFYSNLMQRTDVHPMKGDKSDWESVNGAGRIKRMREFTPRYLRQFSRKKNKKLSDFQKFLLKWRKFSIDFLHSEYWKPVQESNKNYGAIVGNLWQKICNMTGMLTAEYASGGVTKYDIITYELFVIMERVCKHQQFIAYLGYKHMCTTFIMNFNMYDVNDSNAQGKIAWCEGAMVGMIKYANRPTMSLHILNHITDLLIGKLGGQKESVAEEKENSKDKDLASIKIPKVWNVCCKRAFLRVLCIAIDCTESAKAIKDIKGKEGGVNLIKKLSELCLCIFFRTENSSFPDIIEEGYKLLSRIDIMNSQLHDKVLKQMQSHQIKKYNRNFGKARIVRFGGGGADMSSPKYGSAQSSKIKPGYGAESPTAVKGYTQKYRIGQLGASVAMNKMKSISTKSRIIDVNTFNKLQSPFEFKLQKEDVISAFRYADVNQDNAISFTDFTQSLVKVGVVKDDDDAREMWLILNPSNSSKGVNLDKFERKLRQYPTELHNWLCRIISCNHLARQPFKTDPDAKSIKKILKDQRKLTWKERIDALHSVARLFARTNDSKKEFQNKFKSFLPRLLDHLRDPHSLVVRAACVSLTKIMIYKNGSMTKYTVKIMEALTLNFKKNDRMVTESCFGCFANLVRHVPDNKKFATLQHILKLVQFKNVSVRCFGWRIAAITFERILGLKKARPSSWWTIAENILKTGKKEKSNIVQREAIRLLFIFQNSSKHYHYIEQYIRFFPVPDNMESLKSTVVSDIQTRMDEYATEAAAQADAMDVYSLISTEQDAQEENMDEKKKQSNADEIDSVGGGRFDFVDDIMDGKEAVNEAVDPLANRGLGKRLILHAINRDTVARVYELYDIGHSIENTRTLLASLKYLGINIGRGELTLLLSEIKNIIRVKNDSNEYYEFTPDKYAFFVKHCFATLDVAWKTYLSSSNMDDEIAEFANISNVKKEFDSKMLIFESLSSNSGGNMSGNDLLKKCLLMTDIYNLFVTPEVENDEILFEEMMERINPIMLHELAGNMHSSILIQEICIIICRITQYHISRVAEYGSAYYDLFFQIIGYGSSIVSHCCSKTCLVIASMVQFLNVPTANDMTQSLMKCMDLYPHNQEYQLKIYKCLLAEILVNVPLIRDQQIQSEVIQVIWSIMKEKIYQQIENQSENNQSYRIVCLNILAYMHSATYLNLFEKEAFKLNEVQWKEIELIKKSKKWDEILRQDIDANETAPFNNLALEHGWDNLKYYSNDFTDRNLLLEQWYELEEKTNNPIGMAAVTQLIKALNYTQYKAKKTQTQTVKTKQTNNKNNNNKKAEETKIHNATGGGNDLNSLRAKYLEMQRKQNQQKNVQM